MTVIRSAWDQPERWYPERVPFDPATASPEEAAARKAGWFPIKEAHVMFREGTGVCRHLVGGEVYNSETDSYMSTPLRHANSWKEACEMDKLGV
jgi:hypothetical protein